MARTLAAWLFLNVLLQGATMAQVEFIAARPIIEYVNGEYPRFSIASMGYGRWFTAVGLSPYAPGVTSADIAVLRSLNDGATWDSVATFDSGQLGNPATDHSPVLASDASGTTVVA